MTDEPSFLLRAVGAAVAIAKVAVRIEPTEPETLARRIATCQACPSGCFIESPAKCDRSKGGCGCFLAAKWRIAGERCPKGHW